MSPERAKAFDAAFAVGTHTELTAALSRIEALHEQALAELKAVTAERDGAREMMEQARRELRDLEAELRFLKQECGS